MLIALISGNGCILAMGMRVEPCGVELRSLMVLWLLGVEARSSKAECLKGDTLLCRNASSGEVDRVSELENLSVFVCVWELLTS